MQGTKKKFFLFLIFIVTASVIQLRYYQSILFDLYDDMNKNDDNYLNEKILLSEFNGFKNFTEYIKNEKKSFDLTFNERLRYYLNDKFLYMYIKQETIIVNINKTIYKQHIGWTTYMDEVVLMSWESFANKIYSLFPIKFHSYRVPAAQLLRETQIKNKYNLCNSMYLVQFGDKPINITDIVVDKSMIDLPIFKKTRYIGNDNIILLQTLDYRRHWIFWDYIDKYDIDFNDKKSTVIWRGGLNNYEFDGLLRARFAKMYENYPNKSIIDVMSTTHNKDASMSKKELLKYKYIVIIQGNDVATSFGWIMYSNSVPFILTPILKESWGMQGLLIPYYHYIPINLDNNNSLINAYNYCQNNINKCIDIKNNAKRFMQQFKNKSFQKKIRQTLFKISCKITKFEFV